MDEFRPSLKLLFLNKNKNANCGYDSEKKSNNIKELLSSPPNLCLIVNTRKFVPLIAMKLL